MRHKYYRKTDDWTLDDLQNDMHSRFGF